MQTDPIPGAELFFLPLGGCEEIGMNLNAYGYGPENDRRWIIADMGVTFGDETTPGVDLICADPEFLVGEQIEAIFLTHAHEDHIGATGLLYRRLQTRAPMYATPFTAELTRAKLAEHGLDASEILKTIELESTVQAGPFSVRYVTLTHSIPEPNALAIATPLGMILHTGDWKIDPDPRIGATTDVEGLSQLGDEGVLAMVCDSTNVFVDGEAGSEATVRGNIETVIAAQTGRVCVTTFASNVARVKSVIEAAAACGRSVCLVGRSMHKVTDAAKSVGMLQDVADFVDEEEAGYLPPESILYLCTGSQGEARAALSRIARGDHRNVSLSEGDTVIFSSRVIPGNEKGIFALMNQLADMGVQVITDRMSADPIHVSGHPCRDELARMYGWVRPQISVPVHGERRHTLEHARYALSMQVPLAVAPRNGELVKLAPGDPEIIDVVPTGRLILDGARLVPADSGGLTERKRLAEYGYLHVAVAIDEDGDVIDGPLVTARGFVEEDGRLIDESLDTLDEAAEAGLVKLKRRDMADDDAVERAVGRAVRKAAERLFGRRPVIDVTVLRS
ncbi:MAG: ribonuclease J [Hyphomonadaceae bacterium]|nr:ribonuclease J [Hyphomonadaceae bacterium]